MLGATDDCNDIQFIDQQQPKIQMNVFKNYLIYYF
jgi:hypothetical protein